MLYQPILAAVSAALCNHIDEAALRQQRLATAEVSLPAALLSAGLWLAARGWDEAPCAGETFFAWSPAAYRRYLARLTPEQQAAEIEEGRRIIFDGRGSRPPLLECFTSSIEGFCTDAL